MAYVSHVIDELQDEIAENTDRVVSYLERSLSVAAASSQANLYRQLDRRTFPTPPPPPGRVEFQHKGVLSFWDNLRWSMLGEERRWRILRSDPRYALAVAAFDAAVQRAAGEHRYAVEQYQQWIANAEAAVSAHNASIAALGEAAQRGDQQAGWNISLLRLDKFFRAADFFPPDPAHFSFEPSSRRVLCEVELPGKEVVPVEKSVRFLKTTGEHRYTYRSEAEIRRLYTGLVAQMVLAALNAVFRCTHPALVETVVVNAVVVAPDPATGLMSRVPVVSVSTHREKFDAINLADVEAVACLKHLSAAVSRNPAEAVSVRPIVKFDLNDPRFIADSDILSELDDRPNLLDLSPGEFESLIQNLFTAMGLDTKQTQASRDGGVDAVAFDHRPVLGGKVIIQAKRYKNTVGVSAVRDLFGAVMNEGASKGILVTTSGYGKASFDFALGKPLELLDGPNLLHLLKEHAGIDARIIVPEDWVEPSHQG